jgi:hypothetical protein
MNEHTQRAVSLADKVVAMAEHALAGLELSTKQWPAEFRVIIWEVVADIAARRADAARPRVVGRPGHE